MVQRHKRCWVISRRCLEEDGTGCHWPQQWWGKDNWFYIIIWIVQPFWDDVENGNTLVFNWQNKPPDSHGQFRWFSPESWIRQVGSWFKDVANSGWYDIMGAIFQCANMVIHEMVSRTSRRFSSGQVFEFFVLALRMSWNWTSSSTAQTVGTVLRKWVQPGPTG